MPHVPKRPPVRVLNCIPDLGQVARAEDVVQEAFLRLQLAADESVVIESPKAYLTTMPTRLAIDHLRSAGVRQRANKLRRRVDPEHPGSTNR